MFSISNNPIVVVILELVGAILFLGITVIKNTDSEITKLIYKDEEALTQIEIIIKKNLDFKEIFLPKEYYADENPSIVTFISFYNSGLVISSLICLYSESLKLRILC